MLFSQGEKVKVLGDEIHTGTVERQKDDQTYVRWHRGFATWEKTAELVRAVPETACAP